VEFNSHALAQTRILKNKKMASLPKRLWKRIVRKFIGFYLAAIGTVGYKLISRSNDYFAFKLKPKLNLDAFYVLYSDYRSYNDYTQIQEAKTRGRLEKFFESDLSIAWTTEENIKHLSRILLSRFGKKRISGVCMGSRSGEEQWMFNKYLGARCHVIGVELTSEAQRVPNTIIADFHHLPEYLLDSFEFVYSNSHDQSNNPRMAFSGWIDCLKIGGLLILEHSRAHGKSRAGAQDPFGAETELLPYVMMSWFSDSLTLEGIIEPPQPYDAGHKFLVFSKKEKSLFST